jgi:signal transduction histidine kinase
MISAEDRRFVEIPQVSERRPETLIANVLIVDDDGRSRYALERTLEDPGLNLVTVSSGREALRRLLEQDFALILLDVRMPGMDGYETAALIRQREKTRSIPIIFLTAIDKDEVHIFRGYTAGAVDYVFKPAEPLVLKSKVAVFVDLYRKTEIVRREEELKRRLEHENLVARIERERAEHALRAAEERQSLILDSLPVALYAAELGPRYAGPRFIGRRIEHLTGFSRINFDDDGTFWSERIHPADRDRVLADVASIATESSFATEYRWRCTDDSYGIFLDRAVVVRRPGDGSSEIVGMWLDVTQQRQLQEQLVQAQKMDAVGRLTGGIAHDFSNMLTAVLGNLDLLRRSVEPDTRAWRRADLALQSAMRCSDLTQRLLAFARQKPLQPDLVEVNAVVGSMMGILNRTFDDKVEIELRLMDDLWPVYLDRSQIESTFLNLAINARDALPDGGCITIETANVHVGAADIGTDGRGRPGEYVTLTVIDNGVGMPPAVRERVFEPFFTTKEPGRGTGLGLSMAHSFVEQSGGFIRIESEVGVGTAVRLYFKRADVPAARVTSAKEEGEVIPRAKQGEVVLTVEDDVQVLRATAESLREFGYEVLEAENARTALEILAEKQVDLLFSDIAMPGGMTGRELAKTVAPRFPDMKVLLTSGYPDRMGDADGGRDKPLRFLRKPYRDHELAWAVREALDDAVPVASAGRR